MSIVFTSTMMPFIVPNSIQQEHYTIPLLYLFIYWLDLVHHSYPTQNSHHQQNCSRYRESTALDSVFGFGWVRCARSVLSYNHNYEQQYRIYAWKWIFKLQEAKHDKRCEPSQCRLLLLDTYKCICFIFIFI